MEDLDRREFLKSAGRISIVAATVCHVPTAQADGLSLIAIHPVRYVAGLIFDALAPVLVRWAVNGVIELIKGNTNICGFVQRNEVTKEKQFNHPAYKAAVVTLGVADYEQHRQRQLRLLLRENIDIDRFNLVRDYLRHEKISLKTTDMLISDTVGIDLEPDDLFRVEYFVMRSNDARHYRALEKITKVNVFKQLRSTP